MKRGKHITARIPVRHAAVGELPAFWRYDPIDPWAVAIEFRCCLRHRPELTWLLARDLLTAGLDSREPVGEGDIRIHAPLPDVACIHFTPRGADVQVHADRRALREFLQQAYAAVPPGTESHHQQIPGSNRGIA